MRLYPEGHPWFLEPIQQLLSKAELNTVREGLENRACEPWLYYCRAIEGGDTPREPSLATALELIEPEEERFFCAEDDLQRALSGLA